MKYRFINWIRTPNWEGAMIESPSGKRYYTSGICIWEATPEREKQVQVVPEIDIEAFIQRWNSRNPYSSILRGSHGRL